MKNNYCVYIHQNRINGKRYVGITSQVPESRWRNGAGYSHQVFGKAIKKYGWNNFNHIIISDNLSEEEAKELEIKLIKQYKTQKAEFGYNIAEGGGATSPQLSNKTYQYDLQGNFIAEYDSYGKAEKITGIRKDLIGQACLGHAYTAGNFVWSCSPLTSNEVQEIVKKRDEMKEKAKTEGIKKASEKISMKIQQIDFKTGEIIAEYASQREASRATSIDQKGISNTIAGKYKQSGGFIWRKVE